MPVMLNEKTVDPRDKKSTKVIQLETAMGAAISCFPGAQAILIPRTRFAPVRCAHCFEHVILSYQEILKLQKFKIRKFREFEIKNLQIPKAGNSIIQFQSCEIPKFLNKVEKIEIDLRENYIDESLASNIYTTRSNT